MTRAFASNDAPSPCVGSPSITTRASPIARPSGSRSLNCVSPSEMERSGAAFAAIHASAADSTFGAGASEPTHAAASARSRSVDVSGRGRMSPLCRHSMARASSTRCPPAFSSRWQLPNSARTPDLLRLKPYRPTSQTAGQRAAERSADRKHRYLLASSSDRCLTSLRPKINDMNIHWCKGLSNHMLDVRRPAPYVNRLAENRS
jgi:hypothetical protein